MVLPELSSAVLPAFMRTSSLTLNDIAPVPPFATATVSVTLLAVPVILLSVKAIVFRDADGVK